MYPSVTHPSFGIFVKAFETAIVNKGFEISSLAVIRGKGKSFSGKFLKYLKFYAEIVYHFLLTSFDIVYIHYPSNCSPLFWIIRWFRAKPIVVNFHGGDLVPLTGLERYTFFFTRRLVRKSCLIVVPSEYFKRIVISKFNVIQEKVLVYPSGGIDRSLFKPSERILHRQQLKIDDCFVLGFVSRISHGKGWDIFVDAFDAFTKVYPMIKVKAVIAGAGEETEQLQQLIKKRNQMDNVLYLGEVKHAELPQIFNLFDVFVFSTMLSESLGLVGLEAMSCGVPVIASNLAGIKEYVKEGQNGLLFETGNAEDLLQKIIQFYTFPRENKEVFINEGIETAKTFDKDVVIARLANALSKL
jgi:glycosyltransferase involved in cell wall biosynthesis